MPLTVALASAAVSGFVFCLMELVWYRLLTPLLGGTVFSFALILAVALLGLGLGAAAYASRPFTNRPTLQALAWTCMVEGACLAIPYAIGDRLAVLAILLHPLGFGSELLQTSAAVAVTSVVVLAPAAISGAQLPLLIGLLGEGDDGVGRDAGSIFAFNTFGSVLGSLAGAFGLIPALSALGCWHLAVWLLLGAGGVAVALDVSRRRLAAAAPLLAGAVALVGASADGPTAAWRHSPIGAGRVALEDVRNPNAARAWERLRRRSIAWEQDGIESSLAIDYEVGLSFVVNGKIDGSARSDAGTPVMLGLLGAMLVDHPTKAMVIGLGTGETAGWLAQVESIARVDVAELEPAMLEVARRASVINCDALHNQKIHVEIGDARELLLTSGERYDVIASEPSNPFRAGIASLFTREYYEAVAAHLDTDGVFAQWLQGYEVNATAVQSVYATLGAVFPEVQTWELSSGDIAFVASKRPIVYDLSRIRRRMDEAPYRSAVGRAWRASDIEGLFAHFVASADFARRVRGTINLDDRNVVEFAMARSLGPGATDFGIDDLRRAALARGLQRPDLQGAAVDWSRVDEEGAGLALANGARPRFATDAGPDGAHRMAALRAFEQGYSRRVVDEWHAQPREPIGPTQTAVMATALADLGDEAALSYSDTLREYEPAELDAVLMHLRMRQGHYEDSMAAFEGLCIRLKQTPWPLARLVVMALNDARALLHRDPRFAPRIYGALREPFVLYEYNELRMQLAFSASLLVPGSACVDALHPFEPNVPWDGEFLASRAHCYRANQSAMATAAERDLGTWQASRPPSFEDGFH